MLEQPIRIYAKKRLGAFPELDQHIIYDDKATRPQLRYLVCGEIFKPKLVDARECVMERLKIQHANPATEVPFTPATGWTTGRKTTTQGEGRTMNAVVDTKPTTAAPAKTKGTPGRKPGALKMTGTEMPAGKWLEAIQKLTTWEAAHPKPAEDAEEQVVKAWKQERARLQGAISYQRLQAQKKIGAAPKAVAPAAPVKEVVYMTPPKFEATVKVGGCVMHIDTIDDLELAVRMIKGLSTKSK